MRIINIESNHPYFCLGFEYEWKQFDKHNNQHILNPRKIRNFRLEEYSHANENINMYIKNWI